MLTAHILYIYGYQILITRSTYLEPPLISIGTNIDGPDLENELESEIVIL